MDEFTSFGHSYKVIDTRDVQWRENDFGTSQEVEAWYTKNPAIRSTCCRIYTGSSSVPRTHPHLATWKMIIIAQLWSPDKQISLLLYQPEYSSTHDDKNALVGRILKFYVMTLLQEGMANWRNNNT